MNQSRRSFLKHSAATAAVMPGSLANSNLGSCANGTRVTDECLGIKQYAHRGSCSTAHAPHTGSAAWGEEGRVRSRGLYDVQSKASLGFHCTDHPWGLGGASGVAGGVLWTFTPEKMDSTNDGGCSTSCQDTGFTPQEQVRSVRKRCPAVT